MSITGFKSQQFFTCLQDFNALITTPVGTSTAARTDTIDPRISIALDIISRVCDNQEKLVQNILREEQGHKVCFKCLCYKQFSLICAHVTIESHRATFTQKSSIIAQIVFLLDHLAKNLTRRELPVAMKTLQALTQICFGNFNNQEVAIQGQVVMSINCLLEIQFSNNLVMQEKFCVKYNCLH